MISFVRGLRWGNDFGIQTSMSSEHGLSHLPVKIITSQHPAPMPSMSNPFSPEILRLFPSLKPSKESLSSIEIDLQR